MSLTILPLRQRHGVTLGAREPPRARLSATIALLCALAPIACGDDSGPEVPLGAQILLQDTTIFKGDSIRVSALIQYENSSEAPESVVWTVSDDDILSIRGDDESTAVVRGIARGSAQVIARIDAALCDSLEVTVVEPGDVRWRRPTGTYATLPTPALDGSGNVYVVYRNGAEGRLAAFAPIGAELFGVQTCDVDMAPSVTASGLAYVSTANCTQQHGSDGAVDWSLPVGTFAGGVAVDADGSVYVVYDLFGDQVVQDWGVMISKVSPSGAEVWRDTLHLTDVPDFNYQMTAPAIAANDEVYFMWMRWDSSDYWLSRISPDGVLRWTVPLPDRPRRSSPALFGDRVAVTYTGLGGLVVHDTTGQLLWDRTEPGGLVSSPVVDGSGNFYVQSTDGLMSYDTNGNLRWSADSLNYYSGLGVGAPILLSDGHLLAPCDGPTVGGLRTLELCAVDGSNGSLTWRSNTGWRVLGTAAVTRDGMIYVVAEKPGSPVDGELISLWNRVAPLDEGWPTEGGDMGRLRRQR